MEGVPESQKRFLNGTRMKLLEESKRGGRGGIPETVPAEISEEINGTSLDENAEILDANVVRNNWKKLEMNFRRKYWSNPQRNS